MTIYDSEQVVIDDDVDELLFKDESLKKNKVKRVKKTDGAKDDRSTVQKSKETGKRSKTVSHNAKMQQTRVETLAIPQDALVNDKHKSDISNNPKDTYSISQLQNALLNLEKRHDDLRLVGVLEAEKRFDDYKNVAEMQIQDYKIMVNKLEDKISFLEKSCNSTISRQDLELDIAAVKEQESAIYMEKINSAQREWQLEKELLLEQVNSGKSQHEEAKKQLETLGQQLEMQSKSASVNDDSGIVKFYEGLSGLSIVSVLKDQNVTNYSCSLRGKNGNLLFQIRYSDLQSDIEYIPLLEETCLEVLESLPPYLVEEIEFERSMLPSFFLRMITYLKS